MHTINFKNFRRFDKLENPIELSGITFFVGGNNAGKSTVVKAMMLMLDNLAGSAIYSSNSFFEAPSFRLDANRIHEVHVGTFGRALHKPYPEKKEFCIESEIDGYHICYTVTGDTESKQANADIAKIEIKNLKNEVLYSFDFQKGETCVNYNTEVLKKFANVKDEHYSYSSYARIDMLERDADETEEKLQMLKELQADEIEIQNYLKSTDDPKQIAEFNNRLKSIKERIKLLQTSIDPFGGKLKIEDVEFKCELNYNRTNEYVASLFGSVIESILGYSGARDANVSITAAREKKTKLSKQQKAFLAMVSYDVKGLRLASVRNKIEYISAHSASQKVLFSIEDKNDYMANVIREFKQCRIKEGSPEDLFVLNWMKNLNIGLGFEISSIEGEAYTLDITNMTGEKVPLADMGMGSIQMMLLLLKLATIINSNRGDNCIVIVEEPEQNVHPKLQSELARLFTYVHNKYHFRFVIETHSEYMIRKTQAMIAKGYDDVVEVDKTENEEKLYCATFDNNPFKVYYFSETKGPYDMCYLENGTFKNSFGKGFYDEASSLSMTVLKARK